MSMTLNNMNRRKVLSQIISIGTLSGTTGLVGCSTKNATKPSSFLQTFDLLKARKQASTEEHIRISSLPITHPDRIKEYDRLWERVVKYTDVIPISNNRLRIDAGRTAFAGKNFSEQNFFIRAAAQTLKSGYDGFVVVHLDYYSQVPNLVKIVPDINSSSRRWIGNYEDFLENRNEQNMFSSRRQLERKSLDGVIYMLNKEERPNRDRFSANEIYHNLLNYRAHG